MRWPWRKTRSPGTRIYALTVFRNEMRYLPGLLENLNQKVDGIIALDDGSTDGSYEIVKRHPKVLHVLRNPPQEPHVWNEVENHQKVYHAAGQFSPQWLIAVDADERLEDDFRKRADNLIRYAERKGYLAYAIRLFELWDSPLTYRADGIWGGKDRSRFFKWRPDPVFDQSALHRQWAPLNSKFDNDYPKCDLILYHLRMIHAQDRALRQRRYQELDPNKTAQPMGYDYLTDTTDLKLKPVRASRDYFPKE